MLLQCLTNFYFILFYEGQFKHQFPSKERKSRQKTGVVAHACNPNSKKPKTEEMQMS